MHSKSREARVTFSFMCKASFAKSTEQEAISYRWGSLRKFQRRWEGASPCRMHRFFTQNKWKECILGRGNCMNEIKECGNTCRVQCGWSGDYWGRRWQMRAEILIKARSHPVLSVPKILECVWQNRKTVRLFSKHRIARKEVCFRNMTGCIEPR